MMDTTMPRCGEAKPLAQRWWWTALVLIGVVAFAIRWYYVSHAIIDRPVRGDAIEYHAYAWNMAHHGVFSRSRPGSAAVVADNFRDPGYPAFLAFWMAVCGDFPNWYWPVLLSQVLLGALTVVFLMAAARRWIPDRWLIAAGLLIAVWPHSVTITSYVLSETLLGFCCALGFLLLAQAFRNHNRWLALAAGLAFGLAAMTNAVLLPFVPLLCLLLWWRKLVPGRQLVALLLGMALLPAAWAIRNTHVTAEESSSSRAVMNLVQGSWPEYHESYFRKVIFKDPEAEQILRQIDREYRVFKASPSQGLATMFARMQTEPWRYTRWYLWKPMLLWDWDIRVGDGDIYVFPTPYSPFRDKPALRALAAICHTLDPALTLLMFLGSLLALLNIRTGPPANTAMVLLLGFVTLVYSVLQSEPRYSIPFRGLEILLVAHAGWRVAEWIGSKRLAVPRVSGETS
ncbi:hypothetical protein RKE25_17920 [Dyella sp. BiH032]|uniref:ArnT family glycosyltransferase n=1 Tax=Dyella sp. BiH032 TaxID=3075430 RepID=UPI002892BEC2|nr:hypothetical protein [Dyella sp. BiH032]WNL45276.1 hypothetical protein RKE25_17920 [Dyella sp. BiH032]